MECAGIVADLHVAALGYRFAISCRNQRHGETRRGLRHRQGCRAGTGLGFDHLGARLLDTRGQRLDLLVAQLDPGNTRKQRQNGDAAVAADDVDVDLAGALANRLGDEGIRANHIQRGYAEDLARVVDASRIEHLGRDRHGRIDRVGHDRETGFGTGPCAGSDQVLDDAGIDVEQVVTRHPGLTRYAGRDHDDIGILHRRFDVVADKAPDTDVGRNVAQVDGNSRGKRRDVVE